MRPLAACVVRVVPAVIRPIIRAHDHVEHPVAVEVHATPRIPADLVGMDVRGQRQLVRIVERGLEEVGIFRRRRHHVRHSVHDAERRVLHRFADAPRALEDGEFVLRRVAGRVLENVHAVVGLVRAVHHEVEISVTVEIHRQRLCPQAHAEIHDEAGIVVVERLQLAVSREGGKRKSESEKDVGVSHGGYDHVDASPLAQTSRVAHAPSRVGIGAPADSRASE